MAWEASPAEIRLESHICLLQLESKHIARHSGFLLRTNLWPAVNERVIPTNERAPVPDTEAASAIIERRASKVDRRITTISSFLKGALTPRRRDGRRTSDHDLPVDWHDPYLMFLALAMLMLSITDAFLTVRLLGAGGEETNPLFAFVLNEHPRLFAALKMTAP